jgi:hypothetical protein
MVLDFANDEVFLSAIEGLPKIAERITTVSEEKRSLVLKAAHQSYVRTAQTLGYEDVDAEEWASTVMSMLESASNAQAGGAEFTSES